MKALSVGSIVESVCGKCNDIMGHTIMAMVGNEIVKVECRVCKSQHRYCPPARAAVREKSTVTMKKGREGDPVPSRQTAMAKATRPAMPKSTLRKSSAAAAAQATLELWQAMVRKYDGGSPTAVQHGRELYCGRFYFPPGFRAGAGYRPHPAGQNGCVV